MKNEGQNDIVELHEDISQSSLYSEDLAPVPVNKRTWKVGHLAAIWVGMAVCVPTYLLASYMIQAGLSWWAALIIIAFANLIITVPMVLNGHAGVKYGIPFPVIGRASFGTMGIHLPSLVRGIVACGWFGVQCWLGGLAFYEIWHAVMGTSSLVELTSGKFVGFFLFWLMNVYFIWRGTESIKWLEAYSAPILVVMGVVLIGWGASQAGGFGVVLKQSDQLRMATATSYPATGESGEMLSLNPLSKEDGSLKANAYRLILSDVNNALPKAYYDWRPASKELKNQKIPLATLIPEIDIQQLKEGTKNLSVQFKSEIEGKENLSSEVAVTPPAVASSLGDQLWSWIFWLTAMVGFWATMSISIADITRYAASQADQVKGQFIGLPATMILYSFVGIFVTCAALINFEDILIGNDAPWDPVSLLGKFESPVVVVIAQIFMIIATLSTNIAANVIAPANAFSNISPKKISFRTGGIITAIIGILICPWWVMDQIASWLIFVSGLLGPVLAILICDYFVIRKKSMNLAGLYDEAGEYSYTNGFNMKALLALFSGVITALIGYFVEPLGFLYELSWFTGFAVSFFVYWGLMRKG